jgi:lipid II isoglutaminyl synthase (glutamine-hydrolysing)
VTDTARELDATAARLPWRARAAIVAGRATAWASRATRRGAGTHVAGRVMLRLDPQLLERLGGGRRVALVSATNGKTTTTRFLRVALETTGAKIASNHTGANMPAGLAIAVGRAPDAPVAILEVDERWLRKVVDPLDAELLVLGNLSRDQLDRFGEVRSVAEQWRTVCENRPGLRVVANASDPHVAWAAMPANTTWVDLGPGWRADAATCPECGELLVWDDSNRFSCTCGFATPETNIRLDGSTLVIGDEKVPLTLSVPGQWNVLNAALAVVAAGHFGVAPSVAAEAASHVTTVAGRYAVHRLPDGRDARILLAKNPAGWSEVLTYLGGRDTGVVMAVNAHLADGRDPSWLWDVPFELLRGMPVAASGERALDVAVRLDYGDVACTVEPDPLRAASRVGGADVHIVASYTQFMSLSRKIGRL